MADRVLRDQCKHGHYEEHALPRLAPNSEPLYEPCLGGQAVTVAEIIADYLVRTSATGGNVDAPAI